VNELAGQLEQCRSRPASGSKGSDDNPYGDHVGPPPSVRDVPVAPTQTGSAGPAPTEPAPPAPSPNPTPTTAQPPTTAPAPQPTASGASGAHPIAPTTELPL